MDKLKFTIHPLFFIFGLYFALTGKVFSFIIFTISAVIHELGHSFASARRGYTLNRVVLMPYGAVIGGDTEGLSYKDEAVISAAGPMTNGAIALFFVALWWFVPDIYPYTETVVTANASLAIINLLPCYPLDGGRFLCATLSLFMKRKKAVLLTRIFGVFLAACLLALFIVSCFFTVNFTVLFFSLFMFAGALDKSKQNRYVKAFENYAASVKRAAEVKTYVLPYTAKVKSLYPIIDGNYYYRIIVSGEDGKILFSVEGENLKNLLVYGNAYSDIYEEIKKLRK